jgi:cohesin loading factor subunit SCC2
MQSARELTAVTWGQELAITLKQCSASLRHRDDSEDEQPSLLPFGRKVKSALRDVWKEAAADVFDVGYALFLISIIACTYRLFS